MTKKAVMSGIIVKSVNSLGRREDWYVAGGRTTRILFHYFAKCHGCQRTGYHFGLANGGEICCDCGFDNQPHNQQRAEKIYERNGWVIDGEIDNCN